MARCKVLSPAMLALHFLLILFFSNLVLGAPAPTGPPMVTPLELDGTLAPAPTNPPAVVPLELDGTIVPAPTDPPAVLPLEVPVGTVVPAPSSVPVIERASKARAIEVLADCAKRGIDIYGAIPKDAKRIPANDPSVPIKRHDGTKFEDMTFVHSFSAESDASLWASAQVFVSQYPELVNGTEAYQKALEKRQIKADPGVTVTVYGPVGVLASGFEERIGIGMWEGGKDDWSTNPQPCQGKGWWIDPVRHDSMYLANIPTYSVGVSFRALGGYNYELLDFRTHSGITGRPDCGRRLYSAGEHTPASCWRHGKFAAKCFVLWQNPSFKAPARECKNGVCKGN
ncbi:hypothetical protein TWF730_008012 [Orbilia blumenaviensis]|uniref:Uncharacterized protein n=1 Tax=Orbilia blumenaviensis TaxID=1796055 RepID=A0AAV9VA19_9PEZI